MKGIRFTALLIAVCLLTSPAFAIENADVDAKAAILIDASDGHAIYEKNADTKETLIDAISKFQMKNDIKLHFFGSYINNFDSRENNFPEPYRSVIDEILALR